jgi:photosystem II stability/assembly factor-like uncharacterized protein
MRNKISTIVVSILLSTVIYLALSVPLFAQWQKNFGPFGFEVTVLAAGNGLVISNGNSLSISTNNGLSWQVKSNGMWSLYCTSAFVSGTRLFAGMSEGNNVGYLFISDDNGANWEQVTIPDNNKEISGFAKLGSNLYFCAYDNGIFKSTNNGTSWVRTAYGSPIYRGTCMDVMGSNLLLGTLTNGVLKSTDEGITWQSLGDPNSLSMVTSIAVKGNSLFVTYAGWNYENAAYRTDNLGGTWVDIGQSLQPYFRSIYSDGINAYLSTDKGVFKTTNNGATWNQIFFSNTWAQISYIYNGNIMVGTREIGIYTSTNNGASWINTGNSGTYVQAISTYNNVVFTGSNAQTGITISRDNGNTFTEFKPLLSTPYCFAVRGTDIFAGTEPYIPLEGGLFKSTNTGATWTRIGLADKEIFSVCCKGSYIFAGSVTEGAFRTSNEGATWAQINTGLTQPWVKSFAVLDPLVFAGTNSGIFSTSNNGSNWNTAGLAGTPVNGLAVIGTQLFAGTGSGVYLRESSGTWTQVGFANTEVMSLRALDTKLFAVLINGIYMSTNNGANWILKSQGLPLSSGCFDIAFSTDYAYVSMGPGEGLYRRPLIEVIGVQNISTEIPEKFSLSQNYPNPFNPSTKIKFSVPSSGVSFPNAPVGNPNNNGAGLVTLKVYDVSGKELATLVNEQLQPGTYETDWNASSFSSGVYFYKITACNFSETKKMILMK